MSLLSRLSLKHRIALLSALLGLCLSSGFAATAWLIAEDYEELMMNAMLEAEAYDARAALAVGQEPRMPRGGRLHGWHLRDGLPVPSDLPAGLADLPDGVHEALAGQPAGLHVTLITIGPDRLVYLMDLEGIETLERYLLLASLLIVLVGGLASALAGQWLAGRALRPLAQLATTIETLPPPPAVHAVAPGLHDPLLRQLGLALDSYQTRLSEAERTREDFFADASHELRTPITSLRGAVEVLLDDDETAPPTRRRLQRIDRAVEELGQLLDGLLLSARHVPSTTAGCRLDEPLLQALQRLQARAAARAVALRPPDGLPGPALTLPAGWVEVLLLNILRSIIDHAGVRTLRLAVQGTQLVIQVEGIEPSDWQARSDRGFGLRLARSLGQRLSVQVRVAEDGLRLDFAATTRPTDRSDGRSDSHS